MPEWTRGGGRGRGRGRGAGSGPSRGRGRSNGGGIPAGGVVPKPPTNDVVIQRVAADPTRIIAGAKTAINTEISDWRKRRMQIEKATGDIDPSVYVNVNKRDTASLVFTAFTKPADEGYATLHTRVSAIVIGEFAGAADVTYGIQYGNKDLLKTARFEEAKTLIDGKELMKLGKGKHRQITLDNQIEGASGKRDYDTFITPMADLVFRLGITARERRLDYLNYMATQFDDLMKQFPTHFPRETKDAFVTAFKALPKVYDEKIPIEDRKQYAGKMLLFLFDLGIVAYLYFLPTSFKNFSINTLTGRIKIQNNKLSDADARIIAASGKPTARALPPAGQDLEGGYVKRYEGQEGSTAGTQVTGIY